MTAARGCATIILAVGLIAFLLLAGTNAIVDRFVDWRESANQAYIVSEQTDQIQIWQEQETIRHEKTMDTWLEITKVQEQGLTDRTEMHYDTTYWVSWTSVAHRLLTLLLITAALLWVVVGIQWYQGVKRNAEVQDF